MTPEEAKKVVSAFQERLQDRLFEIENKVDNAAALLAGGAFTVSLAIVPMLDPPLRLRWALVVAWASWAACLLVDLLGHMTSAAGHRRMLLLLSKGIYSKEALEGGWHRKAIPWMNKFVFLLLVSGFVAFSGFVLGNLTFGEADEEVVHQQEGKGAAQRNAGAEVRKVDARAEALREQSAAPAPGMAQTPTKEVGEDKVKPAN